MERMRGGEGGTDLRERWLLCWAKEREVWWARERERERGREVVRAAVNCAERAGWRRECCGVMLSALQGGTEVGG